ncbi:MAG TPA: hypothetical protein VIY90_13645 [Steroidobacteraceae bacterium]
MAQPVKVGDSLIEAARAAAEENNRSMAAQIEHWALLGRAVEKTLTLGDAVALKRSEGQLDASARARIAQALSNALDPGRSAVTNAVIGLRDPIRYETDPALPGLLIQRRSDGTRRIGRMVNREFVVIEPTAEPATTR